MNQYFAKGDLVYLKGPATAVNLLSQSLFVSPAHRKAVCKFTVRDIGLVVDTLKSDIKILSSQGEGWVWDGTFEKIR